MLGQIVRMVIRMSAGLVMGAAPGALYGSLVSVVHLGVYGGWDRIPAFAVGCVLVGALFGLLGSIGWAVAGEAAPGMRPRATAVPSPVATGSQGGNPFFQAPLEVPARPSDNARTVRPSGRRPCRAGLRPRGSSRGCAWLSRRHTLQQPGSRPSPLAGWAGLALARGPLWKGTRDT